MIKKKEINIPIFNQSVIFLVGERNEIIDYLSDVYGTDQLQSLKDGFIAACCNYNGLPHIVIDPTDYKTSIFIHELDHAVYTIMNGVGLDIHDEEAFCYIDQYLYEQCENMLPIPMEAVSETESLEDEPV